MTSLRTLIRPVANEVDLEDWRLFVVLGANEAVVGEARRDR